VFRLYIASEDFDQKSAKGLACQDGRREENHGQGEELQTGFDRAASGYNARTSRKL